MMSLIRADLTISRKYRNLPPRTRILIGLGVMAYAATALTLSDAAEKPLGYEATEEDRQKLKAMMPKITAVDKAP